MAQLLVRDIDDEIVRLLAQRARSHGRSAEAEHKAILESVLRDDRSAFADKAEQLVAELQGRVHAGTAAMIRADRDRDGIPP